MHKGQIFTSTQHLGHKRITHRLRYGILAVIMGVSIQAMGAAREASPILAVGVLAHDIGPLSDYDERGVDLNVEVLFTPLNLPGSPRPHLGATLNFSGDTSAAYAGLTFPFHESRRWFMNGFIGGAVHNGPLHKDPVRCRPYSDCGFGARYLPHFGLNYGYYLTTGHAISLYWDHMSHKWVIEEENEGVDHLGLRYQRPF
jgi:lipid A 3-O-deacylase